MDAAAAAGLPTFVDLDLGVRAVDGDLALHFCAATAIGTAILSWRRCWSSC